MNAISPALTRPESFAHCPTPMRAPLSIGSPDAVLEEYYALTRTLRQAEMDWLLANGVSPLAMARDGNEIGYAIGAAKCIFAGQYFDFADDDDEEAVTAFCVVVRDECGDPADIVAWRPRDCLMAPCLGAVSMVGEQHLSRPRMGEALRVHRDLLGWLRADRTGIVVLNPSRARSQLVSAGPLQAENIDHGVALRETLRPPELNIVIPNNTNALVSA